MAIRIENGFYTVTGWDGLTAILISSFLGHRAAIDWIEKKAATN